MPLIGSILLATLVVSSISLVGIFFTGLKESPPDRLLEYFVSFAAGGSSEEQSGCSTPLTGRTRTGTQSGSCGTSGVG